jgi:hypothetical protein
VAGDMITKSRERSSTKDKLNALKEVGLVVLVMGMTEGGVTATRKSLLMSQLKKSLPDPTYHPPAAKAA